jgi:MFS family permease
MAWASSRSDPQGTLAYAGLLALGALDAAGYSVMAPVLPAISEATGAGPALVGALVATFPVGMMLGFALAGQGVKQHSRAVLIAALAVIALGCLGFVVGTDLAVYFLSRFLMGLGSGGLWIGITFGTLERWPGQEYLCMSRIFAAYSVGGLIGPALGAIDGISGPFLAYFILVCLGVPSVFLMGTPSKRRSFGSDRAVLRLHGFWLASAGILFAVLALGIIEGVLPLHFAEQLTQPEISALYVGASLVVAASAAVAGRLTPHSVLRVGALLILAGLALAGAADIVPLWIVALTLAGIGVGIGETGALGVLLASVGMNRIVFAMVLWSQIGILGYLAGPLAGGIMAERFGFVSIGVIPLLGAAVLAGLIPIKDPAA